MIMEDLLLILMRPCIVAIRFSKVWNEFPLTPTVRLEMKKPCASISLTQPSHHEAHEGAGGGGAFRARL
jgi:hypothetical protein